MYLLDTNLVSELRKAPSGRADARVVEWASRQPVTDFFLSVIALLELEHGVLLMERKDGVQGKRLRQWLENQVKSQFADRVLPIDTEVAVCAVRLHVPDPRPERDALIAATAIVHGLTVVTRNARDFQGLPVPVIDPWRG
ncbi:toxin FitB [Methylomarinovum caldicuralii]|uniref:Toxin FitB n=1 Tax=Methylomarinovum caldicuralii TaxID=438856 RepID=A0AAU9C1E1_9GAMM|nr:type II toxin-antitoxin system VapC family toxin [Methylomarinovum caldicuralii]BCX80955.1 toxin FitB [Methylomarinovum caldicuralii]